jgi:hypothetical protein
MYSVRFGPGGWVPVKRPARRRSPVAVAALAIVTVPLLIRAQQQPSSPRPGWPCGARLDPSYFRVAEGSGGHLMLLAPEEIGNSAALLTALGAHPETIFRLAGSITPGLHDFEVPIDSSIESAVFSVAAQCLGAAYVLRPSGALVTSDDSTAVSNFRAQRMTVVTRPEPGTWTVRIAGSGVAGVVVQARSPIGISQVDFARAESAAFTPLPSFGVENIVRVRIGGGVGDVHAALVSSVLEPLADLSLVAAGSEGSYLSRFTPRMQNFRVLVTGTGPDGRSVQRMYAPLFTSLR